MLTGPCNVHVLSPPPWDYDRHVETKNKTHRNHILQKRSSKFKLQISWARCSQRSLLWSWPFFIWLPVFSKICSKSQKRSLPVWKWYIRFQNRIFGFALVSICFKLIVFKNMKCRNEKETFGDSFPVNRLTWRQNWSKLVFHSESGWFRAKWR